MGRVRIPEGKRTGDGESPVRKVFRSAPLNCVPNGENQVGHAGLARYRMPCKTRGKWACWPIKVVPRDASRPLGIGSFFVC